VLDEVIYFGGLDSAPWPEVPPGVAIQLDPDATDPNVNDDGGVWCPATAAYALGQLGTPRGLNSGC
jgi:hypothetical protein